MRDISNIIRIIFVWTGAVLGWFLGSCDGLLVVLIAFVIMDYITGIMYAVISRSLSSEIGFKGLFRKALIFMIVGMGHLFDVYIIGTGSALRTSVIFFYVSNEGISILEKEQCKNTPDNFRCACGLASAWLDLLGISHSL